MSTYQTGAALTTRFGDRLAQIRVQFHLSTSSLATRLNVSRQSVYDWLRLDTPSRMAIGAIVSAFPTLDPVWVETGEGQMFRDGEEPAGETPALPVRVVKREVGAGLADGAGDNAGDIGRVASVAFNLSGRPGEDFVSVPYYGRVGAGPPRVPLEAVEMVHVPVSVYAQDFGEPPRLGPGGYESYERFGYFTIDGDSAAPVFFDGERLPVQELRQDQFINDLLYVFLWDDMCQLKRLRRTPGGAIEARSLNPSIDIFRFHPGEDREDFRVLALARMPPKQELYTALVGRFLRSDP